MLKAILDLIKAIESKDIRTILAAVVELLSQLMGGEKVPTIAMSKPGTEHPVNTTDSHTITLS
jgi:hypothetical protein